jgi:hypothetical protein
MICIRRRVAPRLKMLVAFQIILRPRRKIKMGRAKEEKSIRP